MPNRNPLQELQSAPKASTSSRALALSAPIAVLALATAVAAPTHETVRKTKVRPVSAPAATVVSGSLAVEVGKAQMLILPEAAKTVFIADPDVADVQATDHRKLAIYGRKPGSTTIHVTSVSGKVASYTVNVERSAGTVSAAIRAQAPSGDLRVTATPKGLTINGLVATPREAEAVKSTAQQFVQDKDAVNMNVGVIGGNQVNLQVRVAEVSRSVGRQFGFNWETLINNGSTVFGLGYGRDFIPSDSPNTFTRDPSVGSLVLGYRSKGGSANINAMIDALQSEGLISILAEPNLTAVSGETASFLAGGEFPVPVAQQQNTVTVEWKKFGVALDFTPTVLDAGRISVRVRPEVSEISTKSAVTINNITIPGISVRRAETTVELASGESFAIAGLFQNNVASTVKQYPWLGEIPVLGPLFRSSQFTHDQSELVIIVTPYIVRPVNKTAALTTPDQGIVFANELEQVVKGKVAAAPGPQPHLAGPAGFKMEEKR
ncbi:type II and III secretion system protein family protein [Phenylobacterium soli]|uniref:Type II and III secretion system protein family protein n=1 Tax=Phenylobacterium soli TaxID=2170551 RepID=A0A328AM36_9CAUL|nr:type II and III secretion system protein family protein [Phenylobacterium soli]RAK55930.1 type II and III secretion system protein family protein [Phenylobacterium soli]